MTFRVRDMRWWDIATVAVIDAEVFGPNAWSPELFWSELAAPGRTYLVAENAAGRSGDRTSEPGDDVIGYAGVAVAGAEAEVATIGVAPSAQRQGLGRRLLRDLARLGHEAGATSLTLEVSVLNTAAQDLYAAEGFTKIGVRRGYYQPQGTDALVLRRRLP